MKGWRPLVPAKRAESCPLQSLGFRAVCFCADKEGFGFRLQPVVLFLEDGAAEQFVDAVAGGAVAFGFVDVVVDARFDGEALSKSPG